MNDILKYHSVTKFENGNYLNVYRDVDLQNKVVNSELGADKKLFFNTIDGVSHVCEKTCVYSYNRKTWTKKH